MHIEFIDLLRCPEPHEETWLVAALNQMDGREVVEAKLGCPVCKREFFIRGGIGIFADVGVQQREGPSAADPWRIAAVLDLTAPGKLLLLAGFNAGAADEVAGLAEARVVALNPVANETGLLSEQVAVIHSGQRIPLASGSLDGIVLDYLHSSEALVAEAARLLRARGRLAVDVSAPLSSQFAELARDGDQVVAERVGELITLDSRITRKR